MVLLSGFGNVKRYCSIIIGDADLETNKFLKKSIKEQDDIEI